MKCVAESSRAMSPPGRLDEVDDRMLTAGDVARRARRRLRDAVGVRPSQPSVPMPTSAVCPTRPRENPSRRRALAVRQAHSHRRQRRRDDIASQYRRACFGPDWSYDRTNPACAQAGRCRGASAANGICRSQARSTKSSGSAWQDRRCQVLGRPAEPGGAIVAATARQARLAAFALR